MLEGIRGGLSLLENISVALPLFAVIAMGIVGGLVWRRTHSVHPLMARLWRLFYGNKDCKDAAVSSFLDEQAALMEFRFTTGVHVRTRRQAHSLIDWTRKNNEDIGDIASCGSYFDLEQANLKNKEHLPNRAFLLTRLAVAFFLMLIALSSIYGISLDKALLQMKSSGTYFLLSEEYAKRLFSKGELTISQCENDLKPLDQSFDANDAKIICNIFKDQKLDAYIKSTLEQQRLAFGLAAVFFAWHFYVMLEWFLRGCAAQSMSRRLAAANDPLQLNLCDEVETKISKIP